MEFLVYALIPVGIAIIYLGAIFRYVPPPYCYVIEINIPGAETIKRVWHPGIHFLWFPFHPFMFIRNKLSLADQQVTLTMGVKDNNPGLPSLVEVADTAVQIEAQFIIQIIDPILATYEMSDEKAISAAINMIEGNFRRRLSKLPLKEAMGDACRIEMAKDITEEVNNAIEKWGIKLVKPKRKNEAPEMSAPESSEESNDGEAITIIDFMLTDEDVKARAKVLDADREAAAMIKRAKAESSSILLRSRAEAARIRMQLEEAGKGELSKIQILSKELGIPESTVREYFLKQGAVNALNNSTFFATKGGFEELISGLMSAAFGTKDSVKATAAPKETGTEKGKGKED